MRPAGVIVAMTNDNIIGVNGKIPWRHELDLRRFRSVTIRNTVIMGRLTWMSIGKPLMGRRNIVLSRDPSNRFLGATCCGSLCEAIEASSGKPWIIGGAEIFYEALRFPDLIDCLDVTIVPEQISDLAAVRFPKIDLRIWKGEDDDISWWPKSLKHRTYSKR